AREHSDAALLARLTFIPAIVWAVIWTLLALSLFGLFAWRSVRLAKAQGFSIRRSFSESV
ncbi:MAG TPA: M50 family metallopeptidase, partial [Myxococcaceae bacterium]|nr:M50 family metallopeptidase [Myxococcaceae bacterium]